MTQKEDKNLIKMPQRILGLALILGWAFDLLFYDKQVGLSLLLFTGLILTALWMVSGWEGQRPLRHNLWLILPLLFFGLMGMVRDNGFITFLNLVAVLILLSYVAFFYLAGRVTALGLLGAVLLPARVAGRSLLETAPILNQSLHTESWRSGRQKLIPILRGVLIALPILFIFTLLLASADLIFSNYLDQLTSLSFWPDEEWFVRVFFILSVAWLLAGGLIVAMRRHNEEDERSWLEKGLQTLPRFASLGFTETMTVLLLVNGLFMSFTAVQFVYLFGGERNINIEGFTYADYARRGFFELVLVAVLSLLLIIGLNWLTRRDNKRHITQFNGLATLLMVLVMVLLVSAFRRMQIYETTFGTTELRLYVFLFIGWLGVLLVWFIGTLWQRPDRFAIGLIACMLGFLITLNLINPDAFITRRNIAHYQATGNLDIFYLFTLSDDAVPELVAALPLLADDPQPACQQLDEYGGRFFFDETYCPEETLATALQNHINGRYEAMQTDTTWRDWQAFHFARYKAFAELGFRAEDGAAN